VWIKFVKWVCHINGVLILIHVDWCTVVSDTYICGAPKKKYTLNQLRLINNSSGSNLFRSKLIDTQTTFSPTLSDIEALEKLSRWFGGLRVKHLQYNILTALQCKTIGIQLFYGQPISLTGTAEYPR